MTKTMTKQIPKYRRVLALKRRILDALDQLPEKYMSLLLGRYPEYNTKKGIRLLHDTCNLRCANEKAQKAVKDLEETLSAYKQISRRK